MEGVTSCTICTEEYNVNFRRPLLLTACGHTFCKRCLLKLYKQSDDSSIPCPTCRKDTRQSPEELPANFSLLALVESPPKAGQLETSKNENTKKWCLDCRKVADESCVQHHAICPLRRERVRQLADTRLVLEASVKSQRTLVDLLNKQYAKIADFVKNQIDEITKDEVITQVALDMMHSNIEETGPQWDETLQTLEAARLRCEQSRPSEAYKLNLETLLSATQCEGKVEGEQGRSVPFRETNGLICAAALIAIVGALRRDSKPLPAPSAPPIALLPESPTVDFEPIWEPSPKEIGSRIERPNGGSPWKPQVKPKPAMKPSTSKENKFVPLPGGQQLDLSDLSQDSGQQQQKALVCVTLDPPVTSVRLLHCETDVSFAKRILDSHGPTLEWLDIWYPSAEILKQVVHMERLRTLGVTGYAGKWSPLCGYIIFKLQLDTLHLGGMGQDALLAIIRMCGGARHLKIGWPLAWSVENLVDILQRLSVLASKFPNRTFTLPESIGLGRQCHDRALCLEQCNAIRKGLPHVEVWCFQHDPDHRGSTLPPVDLPQPWQTKLKDRCELK